MNKFLYTILFCSPCLAMNPAKEGEVLGARLTAAEFLQLTSLVERGMFSHPIRPQIAEVRAEAKRKIDKMTREERAKAKAELEADFQKDIAPLLKQEKLIKLYAMRAIAHKMLEKTLADIKEAESSGDNTKTLSLSTELKLADSV